MSHEEEPSSHVAHAIGFVSAGPPLTFEGRVHIELDEYDDLVGAATKLRRPRSATRFGWWFGRTEASNKLSPST